MSYNVHHSIYCLKWFHLCSSAGDAHTHAFVLAFVLNLFATELAANTPRLGACMMPDISMVPCKTREDPGQLK